MPLSEAGPNVHSNADLDELRRELEEIAGEVRADGASPEEEELLRTVSALLKQAEQQVRATPEGGADGASAAGGSFEAWEARSQEYHGVIAKIVALKEAGHEAAGTLEGYLHEISDALSEDRYDDALDQLDLLMKTYDLVTRGDGQAGEEGTEPPAEEDDPAGDVAADPAEQEWNSLARELEELKQAVDDLTLAGHNAATALFNRYSEILEARTEERWQDAIDMLRDALELARTLLEELESEEPEAEADPARQAWEAMLGDLQELKDTIDELHAAGDSIAEALMARYAEILEARDDERWQDAIDLLQSGIDLARDYMARRGERPGGGFVGPGGEEPVRWGIEVTVLDADRAPVPGVTVTLDSSEPAQSQSGTSDRNGGVRFDIVGPGSYTVEAFDGERTWPSEAFNESDPAAGVTLQAELVLQGAGAEDDRDDDDYTDDGEATWGINAIVTDGEGNRVAGAEVRLNGPISMSMATDGNGEAQFDISAPGRYMVQAFQDDSESNPEVFNETDPADGVILDAELQLQSAPTEPFETPTETNEPTLRRGDEDADGWVEYLQKLLNQHLRDGEQSPIPVSGTFDPATDTAVRWFQEATGCKVDGIVGNQTWSALREDHVRDAIGTDGREPGTHSEQGAEARWSLESSRIAIYDENLDAMRFAIASTGTEPIDDFRADIFIDGARQQITIGAAASSTGGQAMHVLLVTRFRERFGDGPFEIEAYLPQELGGDVWVNTVDISGGDEPEPDRPDPDRPDPDRPDPDRPDPNRPDPDPVPESSVRWVLSAIVRDREGAPVPQAMVEFDGPAGFTAVADASGRAVHEVQGAGRYEVRARFEDQESDTQVVDEATPQDGMVCEVELTIDMEVPEDEGDSILANVEIEIGNDIFGSITAVFDGDGKFAGLDYKRSIAEESLRGGADGLIAGGKVELAAALEGRMTGNKLVITSLIQASGSVMVGLGVASPKSWLGVGAEWSLKFARNVESLTLDLDRSVLENAAEIIKAGGSPPTLSTAFDLPAHYSLSGKFSAIAGGGSGSVLEGKLSKTIKDYNPMITIDVSASGGTLSIEITGYPGAYEFVRDIAYITNPTVTTIVEELIEIAQDPEGYYDTQTERVETVIERISELPGELEDHFGEEIALIRNLIG